jgi:hypothetical protein
MKVFKAGSLHSVARDDGSDVISEKGLCAVIVGYPYIVLDFSPIVGALILAIAVDQGDLCEASSA